MQFLKMVYADTWVLIRDSKRRYIPVVLFFIFNVVTLRASLAYYSNYAKDGFSSSFTCIDAIANLYMGIRPRQPSMFEQFTLPFEWLITLMAPCYLVAGFVERLRSKSSTLFLTFCGNRWLCWLIRLCSISFIALLYSIIMFVVSFLSVFILGGSISLSLSDGFVLSSSTMGDIAVLSPYECWATLGSCVVLSLSLVVVFSVVSYFVGSTYSFIAIAVYLTCSAYFAHPLWLGNFAMVARSTEFFTAGFNPFVGIGLGASLVIFVFVGGGLHFNTCDLLGRGDYEQCR